MSNYTEKKNFSSSGNGPEAQFLFSIFSAIVLVFTSLFHLNNEQWMLNYRIETFAANLMANLSMKIENNKNSDASNFLATNN
jgi:succinate dehydrogenase hydrophobic anchor subunit